jgi:hypothetical protein
MRFFLQVLDSQPFSTISKVRHKMQREMPFISGTSQPVMVDAALLAHCKNRLDAIRLCVQLSNFSNEVIAEQLTIDKGHFSRIMQGKAHFPDAKSIELMMLCGNYAPMQFEAMKCGFILQLDSKEARKAKLLAEIQALDVAA